MRTLHPSRPHDSSRSPWRAGWAVILLLGVSSAGAREGMDRDARIEVIRGMLREVAVTKIAFPRGKKGLVVDASGKLDKSAADTEMHINGAAMAAGKPAEITQIEFKEKQIVFELNGGGGSGKKWYQRIQVDMGGTVDPTGGGQIDQVAEYGSSVTLNYGQTLPDLPVAQLKKILAGVLDFERHTQTVLYSPNVTPEVKEAIKNHNVVVGMDRDAVLSARGTPDRKVREVRDGAEQEDWIYGTPPHVLFVTFDGDVVASVKQY
jgi:hypothetical protein